MRAGERLDDLQLDGLKLIQNERLFCFGIDAVLLSAFARVKAGEAVLDLGTGTGVIPILLSAKTPGSYFTGLEIDPACADMARRSVEYNRLPERVSIKEGDLRRAGELFAPGSFQVVTSNPPYMTAQHGLLNPRPELAAARHELLCTLEDVVRAAALMLKDRGRLYLVHRPFRLAEIFRALGKYGLEPKRMRLVHPYADREPNLVLIEALKGGRPRITVEAPLIVYERDGGYTSAIQAFIARTGADEGRGRDLSGGKHAGKAILVRDADRQPGGYELPGGARPEGGGSDRRGGHQKQPQAAESF